AAGTICLAAQDGIILGSMDHGVHHALGWVNHWALAGLREATFAACELGQKDDADRYTAEADALQQALDAYVTNHPDFFDEERTVNSLLWPTRAWADPVRLPEATARFAAWWQNHRLKRGYFEPEPYWLYFESAQAHNALLMGQVDTVWEVLRYRLQHQDLPGLFGWREGGSGVGTDNAIHGVTLINQLRGCQRFESITPHGWSQAEFWLLQRAVLVDEWQDGLLVFAGVPPTWLVPGARIAFRAFPTWYGRVNGALTVDGSGRLASVSLTGAARGTLLTVRLGHARCQVVATDAMTTLSIDLKEMGETHHL
ncbi:MAG TPA: hypothetical protein VMT34_12480, partial [Aggregatilineales bacterium]|nr:hypothetical protein [Aggregatilineales bacterium]